MQNNLDFYGKKYYFKTWKRSRWLRLVYQNTLFEGFLNENEALYSMNPNKYSILSELTDALKYNNSFEFHLEYPSYKIHWRQNDNPLQINESKLTNGAVNGLDIITNKTDGNKFTGLARSTVLLNNATSTFLDGTCGSSWWYAVCMYKETEVNWKKSEIPGAVSAGEKWMSLWVRVPGYFGIFRTNCSPKTRLFKSYLIVTLIISVS